MLKLVVLRARTRARERGSRDQLFAEADAWEDAIRDFLVGKRRVTVLEVARDGLRIDVPRLGTADQRRIRAVLERAGWGHGKRAGHARWWIPAGVAHDAP